MEGHVCLSGSALHSRGPRVAREPSLRFSLKHVALRHTSGHVHYSDDGSTLAMPVLGENVTTTERPPVRTERA